MIRRLLLVVMLLGVVACSAPDPVAMVDGDPIRRAELDALHPADASLGEEEVASSVYLLILHRLLVAAAREEFDVTVSPTEVDDAFALRTNGLGDDVDGRLAESGITRDRVMLEAELDVIRSRTEEQMIRSGWPGTDLDKAYRDFLATNSRVCLVVLMVPDAALQDDVEQRVEAGDDLDAIFDSYPEQTTRIDMGCLSPLEHGLDLAPVALDGEIGRSYTRHLESGDVYVAKVTERDAPPVESVQEEVLQVAIERQGPDLFNAWAADLLRHAAVEVDDSIGLWQPVPESGDVPTVVTG